MYRQKHRQLGSGSASTRRERKREERQECAIFLRERWQCTFRCVCVQTNVVLFRFSESTLNKLKFVLFRENFLYNLTSAIRFTKLGQISARMPLSLSLSFTHARALSVSLARSLESRILRGAGAWDLGVITVFALLNCFVPQFQLVTHTPAAAAAKRQPCVDADFGSDATLGLRCHLLKIRPNAAAALLQINELTFWQVQTMWEKRQRG